MFDPKKKMEHCYGTSYYISPEVLHGSYNEKCDVWSCGVILYILLSGMPPFNGDTDEEIFSAINFGTYEMDIPEFRSVSLYAKQFIRKLLTYSPAERITIEEALNDDWFNIILKNEEVVLSRNVLQNIQSFNTKNKMQQSIYMFLVNQMTSKEEKAQLIKIFKLC